MDDSMIQLCIEKAQTNLTANAASIAKEWIERIPANKRPRGLEVEVLEQVAKESMQQSDWKRAETEFSAILRLTPQPIYQKIVSLLRRRGGLQADRIWATLTAGVQSARK